jgi:hypothetical protein
MTDEVEKFEAIRRPDEDAFVDLVKLAALARQATPSCGEIDDEIQTNLTPLEGPLGRTWVCHIEGKPFACLTEFAFTLPPEIWQRALTSARRAFWAEMGEEPPTGFYL